MVTPGTFKLRVVMWKGVSLERKPRNYIAGRQLLPAVLGKQDLKPSAGFGLEEDQTPELEQKPTLHSWDNCHAIWSFVCAAGFGLPLFH